MNPKTRNERLVVVGGCAAGMSAAIKAKRMKPNLEVLALEKTAHVSYSACGIPYYVADLVRDAAELVTITPDQFRRNRRIEVLTHHEVVEINPVKKQVVAVDLTNEGEQTFHYDRLVIAVGGCPQKLELPGVNASNVFTIQTLQDGINLKNYIDRRRPKRVVIIGGGYIAMEMAEACKARSLQVIVLERAWHILPDFEPSIAEMVTAELKRNDVTIIAEGQAADFEVDSSGEVQAITLQNGGPKVETDLVLVSIGLKPNTKLARMARVRLGKTGAVSVDWKMETNVANVYAAGDCVEVKNLVTGQSDYVPLGPTANKQGRVAGENIGGGTATFRGIVGTSVFKTFDLAVARTGLSSLQAAQAGFTVGTASIQASPKADYFAGVNPICVTIIFDKRSGRLLGAQMAGQEGVSKRIDIFATALGNKMTLDEMSHLDLSYAPPFAPVWDPVLVAVNVARGRL
ncbi:FAD-dependent oxidoreductase [bacterium]|nr:FAD-dependent oxidoreductase [bacterium]